MGSKRKREDKGGEGSRCELPRVGIIVGSCYQLVVVIIHNSRLFLK